MNWRDLAEQRQMWRFLLWRQPRMTVVQAMYAAKIPWRVWWN